MNYLPGIGIELKKGDPGRLLGRLIAFARVDTDPGSPEGNPMAAMVLNGILAVQANYVTQRSIRDFFRHEFGISLERGIQDIIEQSRESGGLESALDPDLVRDKLESMKNIEFIPIPAKIAHFASEQEILARPDAEDVYYLGHFTSLSHAQLCVNSFPILYQARFREQEQRQVSAEIEEMLKGLETGPTEGNSSGASSAGIADFQGNLHEHLLRNLIPAMLHAAPDREEFAGAEREFRGFMKAFAYPADTEEIIRLARSDLTGSGKLARLELMVEKIEALQQEDFERLERIKQKLQGMQ